MRNKGKYVHLFYLKMSLIGSSFSLPYFLFFADYIIASWCAYYLFLPSQNVYTVIFVFCFPIGMRSAAAKGARYIFRGADVEAARTAVAFAVLHGELETKLHTRRLYTRRGIRSVGKTKMKRRKNETKVNTHSNSDIRAAYARFVDNVT